MPLVYLRPIGRDGLYYAMPVEGPVDPGFGRPEGPDHIWGGVGGRPDRPGQGLPGQGHIDNSLPGSPAHPDNRPPSHPPSPDQPGATLVLVRDPEGVWHYATIAPGSPPPKPVPVPPPDHISNRPPGSGSGNHPSGQPVPPGDWTPPARPDQNLPGAQPKK